MKDSEEAIERVLAGLRDAEAPDGMERRILRALEDRAVRSRSMWRWVRPLGLFAPTRQAASRSLTWGVALASVVAVALAIPAIRRLGHAPAQSSAQSPTQSNGNSVRVGLPTPAPSEVTAKNIKHPSLRSGVGSMRKTDRRSVGVVRDGDSKAVQEMLAVSYPAPPMPLTEQERLLLQIAHKGDPVEVAELNPALRAARDSEEKAEVKKFFEPSTTGENE